jgi:hypothetical protein
VSDDDQLDALWAEVRGLRSGAASASYQQLMNRLGGGARPEQVSNAQINWPEANQLNTGANTLGNVRSFVGQANALLDPTFETLSDAGGAFTTSAGTNGLWQGVYVSVSGAAPSSASLRRYLARNQALGLFSSAVATVNVNPGASAGVIDCYAYPLADWGPTGNVLSFLVAACEVYVDGVPAGINSVLARMEIYDPSSGVVAVSDSWDVIAAGAYSPRQLVAATQQDQSWFRSRVWRWRLKVTVNYAGGGSGLYVLVAEPQLHMAYTPDALPFTPAISAWLPATAPAPGLSWSAGNTLPVSRASLVHPFAPSGAGITVTSTPSIAAGISGQEILLLNVDGANSLTLQDQGTLAGSTLRLQAATITIGPRDSVRLVYHPSFGWLQTTPVSVVL